MVLQRWYRLLGYLTLALSCACLIQAEMLLLPGMQLCLPPLLLLIVIAYGVEGRWTLSVRGANFLGVLIVVGTTAWLYMESTDPTSWVSQLPRPTGLIPLVGPVTLCLLVVKLFRPRTPRDFWLLQGLGLLQVGLGCLITGDMPFAVLLAAYVLSALACLTLHYHARERAPAGVGASAARPMRAALHCFALVGPIALLLFLLTPRIGKNTWKPVGRYTGAGSPMFPMQTGMITEIDLNHVGAVYLDEEVAFTVAVTDANGQPRTDLSPEQRWRATVLDRYENGLWRGDQRRPVIRPQEQLPDFGPGQTFLDFKVRPRDSGGLLLAEPLCFGPPDRRLPVVMQPPFDPKAPVFGETLGTILPGPHNRRREHHYRQVLPGPSLLPFRATPPDNGYIESLKRQQIPELREWTLTLLGRLVRERRYGLLEAGLTAEYLGAAELPPEQWEPAARALSDYLASSGEYTYTLELRRQDAGLDPVMDFLRNLKEGHCERYATALALMLRSLGIPTRIVKGYRGAERQEEGTYAVRHSHAHSWVEALVPRSLGDVEMSWLTLDPTPGIEANRRASFSLSRWWFNTRNAAEIFWREMVVRYDAEHQADLWDALLSGTYGPLLRLLGLVAAAVFLPLLIWRLARRLGRALGRWVQRSRRPARSRGDRVCLAFYARLLALLDHHLQLRPRPSQTPYELALAAGERLRGLPLAPALADVPARVAEVFYRVRFGGQVLVEEEEHGLAQQLEQLAAGLRGVSVAC
jgi:transglutaminase-like putative cysteine protease